MKVFGVIVACVVGLFGLGWAAQGNHFFMFQVFAPKYEQVRRDTFEQSKAYRQGMVQELQNMQFEYAKAAPEQRIALASIILHRAADVDAATLPNDLRGFIGDLRSQQGAMR